VRLFAPYSILQSDDARVFGFEQSWFYPGFVQQHYADCAAQATPRYRRQTAT